MRTDLWIWGKICERMWHKETELEADLAGHLHGLWSGLVLVTWAGSSAFLGVIVRAASCAFHGVHAGSWVGTRACQARHAGSGHWESERQREKKRNMNKGGEAINEGWLWKRHVNSLECTELNYCDVRLDLERGTCSILCLWHSIRDAMVVQ